KSIRSGDCADVPPDAPAANVATMTRSRPLEVRRTVPTRGNCSGTGIIQRHRSRLRTRRGPAKAGHYSDASRKQRLILDYGGNGSTRRNGVTETNGGVTPSA